MRFIVSPPHLAARALHVFRKLGSRYKTLHATIRRAERCPLVCAAYRKEEREKSITDAQVTANGSIPDFAQHGVIWLRFAPPPFRFAAPRAMLRATPNGGAGDPGRACRKIGRCMRPHLDTKTGPPPLVRYLPVAVIVAGLALAYALELHLYLSLDVFLDSRERLRDFVANHIVLASLGFVTLYALLVAFAFPAASVVTIAGGFLFGWLLGGTLTVIGATIGATALFLAARHAFGDVLRRRAGGAIRRFAEGFRDDAFAYLLVLRLTPILPFLAVNVAPAFFEVSLRTYVVTTFLGIIPGAMVYAFLGSGLNQTLANVGSGDVDIADLVTMEMTIGLAGLAALAILGLVLKKTFFRRRTAPVENKNGER